MTHDRLSPHLLAAAIAERLDAVLPAGLTVRARDSYVHLYSERAVRGGSMNAELLLEEDGRSAAELLENSAWAILNDIQTDLMEHLREQWPVGGARQAAEPGVRVTGDRLLMWFGDENKPLTSLQPLRLTDLVEGAA